MNLFCGDNSICLQPPLNQPFHLPIVSSPGSLCQLSWRDICYSLVKMAKKNSNLEWLLLHLIITECWLYFVKSLYASCVCVYIPNKLPNTQGCYSLHIVVLFIISCLYYLQLLVSGPCLHRLCYDVSSKWEILSTICFVCLWPAGSIVVPHFNIWTSPTVTVYQCSS